MDSMVRAWLQDCCGAKTGVIFAFGLSEGLMDISPTESGFKLTVNVERVQDRLTIRYEVGPSVGRPYGSICERCGQTLGLSANTICDDTQLMCHACASIYEAHSGCVKHHVKLGYNRVPLKLLRALAHKEVHVSFGNAPCVHEFGLELEPIVEEKMLDRVCSWMRCIHQKQATDLEFSPQGLSTEAQQCPITGTLDRKHLKKIYHSVPMDFLDYSNEVDRYLLDLKNSLCESLGVEVNDEHAQVFVDFMKKYGTKFHLDQGPGLNILLKLGRVVEGEVLASWLFVYLFKEGAVEALNNAAILLPSLAKKFPEGLFREDVFFHPNGKLVKLGELDYGSLLSVQEMKYLAQTCPAFARYQPQCHGDMVVVPLGCAHVVKNLGLSVKIAFDFTDKAALVDAVLAHAIVGARWFGPRGAPDYMNIVHEIRENVEKLFL